MGREHLGCKNSTPEKSTQLVKVNAKVNSGQRKSQRVVNAKVNSGQRKKSTVNAGQSQQSTLGLTWHCADVAVTCLGLTWRLGGVTRGREEVWRVGARAREWLGHRIFRRRVRARPVSNAAVFCSIESIILRSFQRYRQCLDRSPGMADPRAAVGPFRR